jgi:hypothetical protein
MEQLLVSRIAWTRHGVTDFTDEVNCHLEDGWVAQDISIEKKGLRFVCYALLMNYAKDEDEVPVAEAVDA